MLLGVGAKKSSVFVDDVFSTYLYRGTAANRSINNGINLSESGGMVWFKARDNSYSHGLFDTERGASLFVSSNSNAAQIQNTTTLTAFNNNGFSLGADTAYGIVNTSTSDDYSSWSFRKAPGWFTLCEWTGNGVAGRQISHDLSSIPGCIMVKCTSDSRNWAVYHRGMGNGKAMALDIDNAQHDSTTYWNDTDPTASVFTVGTANDTNKSGETYVAYLWAGGESTNALARSVEFDGNDSLSVANSADLNFGSGDFTVECWVKSNNTGQNNNLVRMWNSSANRRSWAIEISSNKTITFSVNSTGSNPSTNVSGGSLENGQWYHVATVRDGNTLRVFVNGIQVKTASYTGSIYNNTTDSVLIGDITEGKISNVRIVKGTAVYTSAFKPPTAPLTSITNTKLLCCNNSSTTGSTTTSGTITASGDPTASTDSPFDDPAGFILGENEDQNVIKCGSYEGATAAVSVNLGWEPSWVMIKRTDSAGGWRMYDNMRGLTDGGDPLFLANTSNSEVTTSDDRLKATSTGFETCPLSAADSDINNGSSSEFIFLAIRRSDGYVGKPPELGTDVFAMDTGNSSSTIPTFDSGFPVDFGLHKDVDSTGSWAAGLRLIGTNYLQTDTTADEGAFYKFVYDSNVGWYVDATSDYQSWMWKRHAGFDVVTYKGNSSGNSSGDSQTLSHSLNAVPQMMWVKRRNTAKNWCVYHYGMNGGVNAINYIMYLDLTNAQEDTSGYSPPHIAWNNVVPTSTNFTVGGHDLVNGGSDDYIAMLFASVDGISSVGFYDGSSSSQTITTGFQPRFVIIKSATGSAGWLVLDTTKGWGDNAQPYPNQTKDPYLYLDSDAAQGTSHDFGKPTSTGFELTATAYGIGSAYNTSGQKFIYYAHA